MDEDFGLDVGEERYRAVLYFDNTMLSVEQVADIIHVIKSKENTCGFIRRMNPTTRTQSTPDC